MHINLKKVCKEKLEKFKIIEEKIVAKEELKYM